MFQHADLFQPHTVSRVWLPMAAELNNLVVLHGITLTLVLVHCQLWNTGSIPISFLNKTKITTQIKSLVFFFLFLGLIVLSHPKIKKVVF